MKCTPCAPLLEADNFWPKKCANGADSSRAVSLRGWR